MGNFRFNYTMSEASGSVVPARGASVLAPLVSVAEALGGDSIAEVWKIAGGELWECSGFLDNRVVMYSGCLRRALARVTRGSEERGRGVLRGGGLERTGYT